MHQCLLIYHKCWQFPTLSLLPWPVWYLTPIQMLSGYHHLCSYLTPQILYHPFPSFHMFSSVGGIAVSIAAFHMSFSSIPYSPYQSSYKPGRHLWLLFFPSRYTFSQSMSLASFSSPFPLLPLTFKPQASLDFVSDFLPNWSLCPVFHPLNYPLYCFQNYISKI